EVGSAIGAHNLDSLHPQRVVFAQFNRVAFARDVEARPAALRIELRVAAKQFGVTALAAIHAFTVLVEKLTGPGALRRGGAQDGVFFWAQFGFPLGVALGD